MCEVLQGDVRVRGENQAPSSRELEGGSGAGKLRQDAWTES